MKIVKTQAQFDLAVKSKAKEIEIQGSGEFVNRTYNGRIVIKGNSAPRVSNFNSSAPRISNHDSSSPWIYNQDSSSPWIYNQDSSAPRIFNFDSSAPRISNRDSSAPQIFEYRISKKTYEISGLTLTKEQIEEIVKFSKTI